MDIFRQQYSLTACCFIFVLHATHMSRDDLSFVNSPPQPNFSIRAMTSFNTSPHQVIHQSSTITSSTSYRFQTSEVTTSFWKLQLSILAQLRLIRSLSIVVAIIVPDHDGRSISVFQ